MILRALLQALPSLRSSAIGLGRELCASGRPYLRRERLSSKSWLISGRLIGLALSLNLLRQTSSLPSHPGSNLNKYPLRLYWESVRVANDHNWTATFQAALGSITKSKHLQKCHPRFLNASVVRSKLNSRTFRSSLASPLYKVPLTLHGSANLLSKQYELRSQAVTRAPSTKRAAFVLFSAQGQSVS